MRHPEDTSYGQARYYVQKNLNSAELCCNLAENVPFKHTTQIWNATQQFCIIISMTWCEVGLFK